jgi:hypothetical protein
MCYSSEVSLGTFTGVSAICIYLWIRNNKIDRAVSLILFVIGFMQLLEWILWENQECNNINKAVTAIIPIYLYLQPVALALIVWQMNAGWGTLYPYILLLLVLLSPFYALNWKTLTTSKPCIQKSKCGHLDWSIQLNIFDSSISPFMRFIILLYYFSMVYVGATLKNKTLAAIFVLLWSSSWIYTNIFYKEVWTSIWCHSVNACAVIALLV